MNTTWPLTRRRLLSGSAVGYLLAQPWRFASPASARLLASQTDASLQSAATGAFVFAYPLMLMDVTGQQMTAVPDVSRVPGRAPQNQFAHVRGFPDATFEAVVSPNVDTLYSTAWLDLGAEPIVLSLPDTGGRYYVMQLLDAWTNVFAAPGPRTTGTGSGQFAIVGPKGGGILPDGVEMIESPTDLVWVLGRTQTNGTSDYDFVHEIQDQYTLTPLSAWGTGYTPPAEVAVDPAANPLTAPKDQVAAMTAQAFWTRFAELMKSNPPAAADASMLEQLALLGIFPGESLGWDELPPKAVEALEGGVIEGLQLIESAGRNPSGTIVNTWSMSYDLGSYAANYQLRAGVAWLGLGANLPEDAIYPLTRVDSTGQPLDGANRYVLHFTPETIPPVEAFWSLSMYNSRQYFADNPIDRYAIGDRDALVFGSDGSLDIAIQHDSPGAQKEANWLPAPEDTFSLMLRLYWPKPQVLDGSWAPPAVTRAE